MRFDLYIFCSRFDKLNTNVNNMLCVIAKICQKFHAARVLLLCIEDCIQQCVLIKCLRMLANVCIMYFSTFTIVSYHFFFFTLDLIVVIVKIWRF